LQIGQAIVKKGETKNPFLIRIPEFKIRKGTVTDYDLHREFKKAKRRNILNPPTPEVGT